VRRTRNTDPKPAVRRCACRHEVTSHRINGQNYRAHCQVSRCGCRLFVWVKAVNPA